MTQPRLEFVAGDLLSCADSLHRLSRLTLSLQVDDAETRAALDWQPPISPERGLAAMVTAFRARS